jgi:hypothetical protein
MDSDALYQAFREYKIKNGLTPGDLGPVAEYLRKKEKGREEQSQ